MSSQKEDDKYTEDFEEEEEKQKEEDVDDLDDLESFPDEMAQSFDDFNLKADKIADEFLELLVKELADDKDFVLT